MTFDDRQIRVRTRQNVFFETFVAAPVGHIICALALLNSGKATIADPNAYFKANTWPDIRYITDINRSTTHKFSGDGLEYVLDTSSSFELGRRLHVFIDKEREKHMKKHDAYRFLQNGPLKTQMLKIIEDHILFDQLKGRFNPEAVFSRIYDEERNYNINEADLLTWNNLLKTYLDQTTWFTAVRYFRTLMLFQDAYGLPEDLSKTLWTKIKTAGFFIYAYFQVEKLSREPELRKIIFDFYQNRIYELILGLDARALDRSVENLQIPSDHGKNSSILIARLFNKAELLIE